MARRPAGVKHVPLPEPEPPTINERGDEVHPAWGLMSASRVSSNPPATLFDSDIQHTHYVVVRLRRASRKRDLMHDRHYGEEQIMEVAMSEAQWASFVSSMNVGEGVPCTIQSLGLGERMPELVHEPRLAETMEEVRTAADKAVEKIQAAFDAYNEKRTAANRRALESAIKNLPANMGFASEVLAEHAENVVQKARADVEAMVAHKAKQLGIDPGELGAAGLLEPGKESPDA